MKTKNILLILLVLLASCYTQKKATEQVNKADSKFPEVVAKLARDKYPCTELLKTDTAIIWQDTTIYIDCPDTTEINPFEVTRFDTVTKTVTKTIRVPFTLPVRTQVITKWFEDSAKLKLAAIAIDKLVKENDKLKTTIESQNKKIANKNKENWIWRIIALCLIAWQVVRFTRKK